MSQNPIGQLQSALFSAAPQLTLALANINFDFTLHKSPAPPEYMGVGSALSKRRRLAAEDGREHIIARKLGALFHKFLPSTPTLIRAYGERASAIAAFNIGFSKGSGADGVFADYAGADGTSIWAAATSSEEAIYVHLLACMLARIWSAPEAIAIWAEIVEERQAELTMLTPEDPLHMSDLAAARLDLTRDDLATWDASARSWLSIADEVMRREQTRLLLLVDKTKLPVDVTPGVYKSVTSAWKSSLTTINKILDGMSHNVHDGAVLLGLASWHLYPDMHVLARGTTKDIEQRDPVIPQAGLLTFGIEGRSPDEDEGVRWSLPLARLRHYGDPVNSKKAMGTHSLRLTMAELELVVLGCIFAGWGRHGHDIYAAADLIKVMWEFLCSTARINDEGWIAGAEEERFLKADHRVAAFPTLNTWFRMLFRAADDFLSSDDMHRQARERLIERGCRRYENFLAPWPSVPKPLFGLCGMKDLCAILHEHGIVRVLRRAAANTNIEPSDLIIRYRRRRSVSSQDPMTTANPTNTDELADHPKLSDVYLQSVVSEDADPIPDIAATMKTHGSLDHYSQGLQNNSLETTEAWTDESDSFSSSPGPEGFSYGDSGSYQTMPFTYAASVSPQKRVKFTDHSETTPRKKRKARRSFVQLEGRITTAEHFEYASVITPDSAQSDSARWLEEDDNYHLRAQALSLADERCYPLTSVQITNIGSNMFTWTTHVENESTAAYYLEAGDQEFVVEKYTYLLGDPETGAVFVRVYDSKSPRENIPIDDLEITDLKYAFESHSVDPGKFLGHLSILGASESSKMITEPPIFVKSLRAIAGAVTAYKLMPNSTVTMSVFTNPVHEAFWVQRVSNWGTFAGPKKAPQVSHTDTEDSDNEAASKLPHDRLMTSGIVRDDERLRWLQAYELDRPATFACIAMFENGNLNVDPKTLNQVMALSAGNSIYVSMPLLCDPFDIPVGYEMKRVVGNIGQPGVSFLIPPPDPRVKRVEEDSWTLVNHSNFDGKFEDSFHATSMHLSFTKLKIPVGLSSHSGQDVEACFRQTLVSLHSKGKWFADLNILGAFESPLFTRMDYSKSCNHSHERRSCPTFQLKSIDNWDEFLDRPKMPGIVRARGNWLGRLAATALNVQQGFPTIVFSDQADVCWACALTAYQKARGLKEISSNAYRAAEVPFFIY